MPKIIWSKKKRNYLKGLTAKQLWRVKEIKKWTPKEFGEVCKVWWQLRGMGKRDISDLVEELEDNEP